MEKIIFKILKKNWGESKEITNNHLHEKVENG